MFLQASTINRADTMFRAFRSGISEFGLPCRVRMDKGGENVQVAQYMLERDDRGLERGSIILLLQLDVVYIIKELKDCGEIFSQVAFHSFTICFTSEECNIFHNIINNAMDLYALHFVFMPLIQQHLDSFRLGWANHSLRTEHGKSPIQLWVSGFKLLEVRRECPEHQATTGIQQVCCM